MNERVSLSSNKHLFLAFGKLASHSLNVYCYFPFQFVSRSLADMSCLHYRTLCTRHYILSFALFPYETGQCFGMRVEGKPQIMLNGSQTIAISCPRLHLNVINTQTHTHQAQHDAIVFACGRFFRSRLFYDYFLSPPPPLCPSPGSCWLCSGKVLNVISFSFHDNLFLITSNQSWHFLCVQRSYQQ